MNQSRSARRSLKTAWWSPLWARITVTKTERRLKNSWLIMNTRQRADNLTEAKIERLSQIIADINSRTGKSYDNDVAVKAMLQIRDLLMKSDKLKTSAKNNSEKDFEFSFYDDIDDALIEGLEQNQDFFTLLLNNEEIKRSVLGIFSGEIYASLRDLAS